MFKVIFITLFGLKIIVKSFIDALNYAYLKGEKEIPKQFRGIVDEAKMRKISSYNAEKLRFNLSKDLFETGLMMLFLFTPLLSLYFGWINALAIPYIFRGLAFFWIVFIADALFMLPADYHFSFDIEEKYGFNGYSRTGWLLDEVKSLLLALIISAIVILPILKFANNIFRFSWIFVLGGTIFLSLLAIIFMYLVPVIFIPLFYKLKPIEDEKLKNNIVELVEKAGFKIKGVFVVDESKKSKHANAMFTGFGNTRSVILFDNLLNNYTEEEILSVLGHEIGHGVHKHILKLLSLTIVEIFAFFLTVSWLLSIKSLYSSMGIERNFYVGLFIVTVLFFHIIVYFVEPLNAAISKAFEYQADAFSEKLIGIPDGLISAFKKFVTNEFSVIKPHPVYEWFYYSHPSLIRRIERLQKGD